MTVLQNYIAGEFVASTGTQLVDVMNPATEEVVAQMPVGLAADVDAAYSAAVAAKATWGRMLPKDRQLALLKIADAVEAHSSELVEAQARNTGQPKELIASEEVTVGADQLRFFAGAARIMSGTASGEYADGLNSVLRREPIGVVGQITPWNYPLMMAIWKIGPALAAGNTIVLKPASTTPESTLVLAGICGEFLPPGTFNVVLGNYTTGNLITSSPVPGLVSITGSVKAGIEVAQAGAPNLTQQHLELGGKAPCVVFADANVEAAATGIATAGYFNAGQDCTAACRVLVDEQVHDEFVAKLKTAAEEAKYGNPDEPDLLFGPLNSARQLASVQGFIDRLPAHVEIVTGGSRVDRVGYFFAPTVLDGARQDDEITQSEIFGPVITVQTFADENQAYEYANGVEFGLASSVWTTDHARALRASAALDYGCVWINTHIPLVAEFPHGGFKHSGYGKDLSIYAVEEYTRIKHVMSSME